MVCASVCIGVSGTAVSCAKVAELDWVGDLCGPKEQCIRWWS